MTKIFDTLKTEAALNDLDIANVEKMLTEEVGAYSGEWTEDHQPSVRTGRVISAFVHAAARITSILDPSPGDETAIVSPEYLAAWIKANAMCENFCRRSMPLQKQIEIGGFRES